MARPRLVTDEQILRAVRENVLQHGPSVSLNQVASSLGVTQPALLKRFGSRQTLMLAALKPVGDPPWMTKLFKGPDERPLLVQLEEVCGALTEYLEQAIPCISALRESGIPHETVMRSLRPKSPAAALDALTRWLERAETKGLLEPAGVQLRTIAATLLGALSARVHMAHVHHVRWTDQSNTQFGQEVAQLIARSLRPHPTRAARVARLRTERR